MYISSPEEISKLIAKIPEGKVMSIAEIANKLAKDNDVDYTCALTTGIFVAVIANYVEEENIKGIPYWRVVKADGKFYEKYFRLHSKQEELLKAEGHKIITKGKNNIKYIEI